VLPDELEHQQLVEIGIEQGAGNGIKLPIVVVRAPGEIDNHDSFTVIECPARLEAWLLRY
jgi:hypothetical protein